MGDSQDSKSAAETEKEESPLLVRMIRVVDKYGAIIEEDRLGFLEGDAVLTLILDVFRRIPREPQIAQNYSVLTP